MPTLYLVATPIGNLGDITIRALRVLGEVALIAAEDTRTTRKLLHAHGLRNHLTSFHEDNKKVKVPFLLKELETKDIALVSEAGTPGISDPGYDLVVAAIESGIPVVPLPGPSAVLAALAVSGLPTRQFVYLGFLPRLKADRRKLLASVVGEERTLVAFEAPHRMEKCLLDIKDILGDRNIAVCRELTKVHEEVFRGSTSQALNHFRQDYRGEFSLVIEGASKPPESRQVAADTARSELRRLKREGVTAREAMSRLTARTGIPRRELYRVWLQLG